MLDVPQTLSPCGVLMRTGIEGCSDVCAVVTVNAGITYLVSGTTFREAPTLHCVLVNWPLMPGGVCALVLLARRK